MYQMMTHAAAICDAMPTDRKTVNVSRRSDEGVRSSEDRM